MFQQGTTTNGGEAGDGGAAHRWSAEEMALFHAALLEHGKDFNQVAQRVSILP